MTDPHEEGPVCDFCKLAVGTEETLHPLYIGELPQPKPHYLTGVGRRGGTSSSRYRGKYEALRDALRSCHDVDLNESSVIHEVQSVGGDQHFVSERELMQTERPTAFEMEMHRDKVGAEITIRPKDVTYEPDAEVCDTCAKMFRDL